MSPRVSFLDWGRGGQHQQNSTLTQPKKRGILVPGLSFPFPNTGKYPTTRFWSVALAPCSCSFNGSFSNLLYTFCPLACVIVAFLFVPPLFVGLSHKALTLLYPYRIQYSTTSSLLTQPRSSGNGRRGVVKGGGQGFHFSLSSSFPTAT